VTMTLSLIAAPSRRDRTARAMPIIESAPRAVFGQVSLSNGVR